MLNEYKEIGADDRTSSLSDFSTVVSMDARWRRGEPSDAAHRSRARPCTEMTSGEEGGGGGGGTS